MTKMIRKRLNNNLQILMFIISICIFALFISDAGLAITQSEAYLNSRKLSGSSYYSLYAANDGIKVLGFLSNDVNKFEIYRDIFGAEQVLAEDDWAAVLESNGTLHLFGNYSKFGAPATLQGIKEVSGGDDFIIVRSADGRINVFGNIVLNERIEGKDRYETAVELSRKRFSSAKYVVVATGENFPDALSAAPLAKALNAPLLLTKKDYLPYSVRMELERLSPKIVYIIGGTGVISQTVENQIVSTLKHSPPSRKRLAGKDRYETSVIIAGELARIIGKSSFEKAYIATGENFPDALSASPLAASENCPLLLTKKSDLPAAVKDFIRRFTISRAVIVGGSGTISDSVIRALPNALRIAGNDRYETSVRLAEHALNYLNFDDGCVYIATGENYPDALAAGAVAGRDKNILLLVPKNLPLKLSTQNFLSANKQIYRGYVIGGTGAVSQSTVDRVFNLTDSNWTGKFPQEIQGKVISISSGDKHVLALTTTGRVYAWGENSFGQCSVPAALRSGTVQIACGAYHSLALKSDGKVFGWGANFAGQIDMSSVNLSNVVKIDGGVAHSAVLKSDGSVVIIGDIGYDHYGNLIEGKNRDIPAIIQGKTIGIDCGAYHTLALTEDGYVYGWGDNKFGQAFGPWDFKPSPEVRIKNLDTTFTIEFNVPIFADKSKVILKRYDGPNVITSVSVAGNKLFIKPQDLLNENYFYYLDCLNGFAEPSEYSFSASPYLSLIYSTWKLFEVYGVSYNSSYRFPVYPYIKFFSEAVETTFTLYRNSAPVLWENGSVVSQPGEYMLYVRARDAEGNVSEVNLNFRIEAR